MTTKLCSKCSEEKPLSAFHISKTHKDGVHHTCKVCRAANRSVISEMLGNAKRRATQKGIVFDLDKKFIEELNAKQNGLCAFTGEQLDWIPGNNGKQRVCPPNRASLDRIDNSRGYSRDNVQLVTDQVNRFRNALPVDMFIALCKKVSQAV